MPVRVPSFEPLEPRLLLSADSVVTQPTAPLGLPQADQAAVVDLTPEAQQQESGQGAVVPAASPVLPDLRLVNPDSAHLSPQLVYLDFSGATDVVYDGPVTIGPLDVPAFQAPAPLRGQEPQIRARVVAQLQETFAGSGVMFTTSKPAGDQVYSTIYIGGDGSIFSRYGSFLGLAEQIDIGNVQAQDEAFVFSDKLASRTGDAEQYAAALAQLIAHEAGHLLGYEHQASAELGEGLLDRYAAEAPVLVDHQATDITQIPESAITAAKANLHIAYGHSSHGSQLITGMSGLVSFANNHGLGLNLPTNIFAFNNGGANGALDLRDTPFSGATDLGNPNFTAWEAATRTYLASHPEVNVVIWAWCGQLSTATAANVDTYLSLMNQLELDYPNVQFVYMTGHLDGTGLSGNLHVRNEQIRQYARTNNKILYDFEDIESYDPDGVYYGDKHPTDGGTYDYNNNGVTSETGDPDLPLNGDRNWAVDWQNSHTQGVDWYSCTAQHTQPLNANRKAYAAWWLWARLAGWNGGSSGNTAPVLAAIGNKSINENQLLTFTASATDSDLPANTLTYSLLNAPTGASINAATGVFSWTPSESQGPGSYNLTVRVTDNGSPNLSDQEAITITVNEVNVAPSAIGLSNSTVAENQLIGTTVGTFSTTDADNGNTFTYSLVAGTGSTDNSSFAISGNTLQTAAIFNYEAQNSYSIRVRTTDSGGLWYEQTFTITVTVNQPNTAPVLAAIGNKSINENQLLTFTASATDSDIPANTLTFSLLNAPAGAGIDPATGVFSWTPAEGPAPGDYNATIRVTDNGSPNLYDEETITITVTVNQANTAPVLAAIGNQSVYQSHLLTFTAHATDSDVPANTLTFSLLNAPASASIDASSGVFTWTPADGQSLGDFNMTVRVTDNGTPNLYDEETIIVTVLQIPGSPVYRFCLKADNSQHFYTIKPTERDKLINNYSGVWTYEGVAFHAFTDSSQLGVAPVYRFWSGSTHFYTMKTAERDKLLSNYANVWAYEGVAFYAYPAGSQPVGTYAVYRFWSGTRNTHFFTISQSERDKLMNNYANVWTYEGTAWYAYDPGTP